MKNKMWYLIALVISLFNIQVQSQNINIRIEDSFIKEHLTKENLQAFEIRGQQKLKDYANYIEIVSDRKYDSNLRKEAVDAALKLFAAPDIEIKESLNEEKIKIWKISDFLNSLTVSSYQKIVSEISNLRLTKELQKGKDNMYIGEVTYIQSLKGYNKKGEQILFKTSEKKAEIILKKVKKQFGGDTEEIWEVLIGKII